MASVNPLKENDKTTVQISRCIIVINFIHSDLTHIFGRSNHIAKVTGQF